MQIEIRDNSQPPCPTCGAYPSIHVPATNTDLEADLTAIIAGLAGKGPIGRRRARRATKRAVAVAANLREKTHYV